MSASARLPHRSGGAEIDGAVGRQCHPRTSLGRTSVDHGTAFDTAGKDIASAQSLVEAIDFALAMISETAGEVPAIEKAGSPLGTH
jgi:hypothetical protein